MKKLFLAVYLLLFVSLNAEIFEIHNITEIHDYLDDAKKETTLVIFDIDNTLTEPVDDIGGDLWFSASVKKEVDKGLSSDDAVKNVLPKYIAGQETLKVKPVEADAVDIVCLLQGQNIATFALTSRTGVVLEYAYNQLKSIGISFNSEHLVDNDKILIPHEIFYSRYFNGLIGCSQQNKGNCLKTFLDMYKKDWSKLGKITNIIFIDDKEKYLNEVESAFKDDSNISFTGLRYSYLDEKVKNYVLND